MSRFHRRNLVIAALVACGLPAQVGADASSQRLAEQIDVLWGSALGERPATPILLLWEMALDENRAAAILAAAGENARALADTLLLTLSLSEPLALRQIPTLHIVRDQSPAGIDAPPTWRDLRRVGLGLLERIALDESRGRDQRMRRELADARAKIERWTPSEVAGLVVLWQEWWTDRGDDPTLYLAQEAVPDISAWVDAYANPAARLADISLWQLMGRLHDDALRARIFVEALDAERNSFLLSECMEILASYPADFERRGLPEQHWNPTSGTLDGYGADRLRAIALEIATRCSSFLPNGVTEHERIRSCFSWWKSARLQARYYRDPLAAPDLSDYLEGWESPESEGGNSLARLLRRLYLEQEIRSTLLDRFGPRHHAIVSGLIEWLDFDFETARAHGFNFSYELEPIRPVPSQGGPRSVITLESVRAIVRQLLERTSETHLFFDGMEAEEQDALWQRWWEGVRRDPRWYRGEVPPSDGVRRLFEPERARMEGR
ncbi:MAG TPA: hypothetical protein VGB13_09265 [Candidatus Krumholzibacteria bacterium]|jgi:hypothetical protein